MASKKLLKTSEAAKILGVSERTVERYVKEMKLIGFKIGQEYRILAEEVWQMKYSMRRFSR